MGQMQGARREEKTISQRVQIAALSGNAFRAEIEHTYDVLDKVALVRKRSDFGGSAIVGCDMVVDVDDFIW